MRRLILLAVVLVVGAVVAAPAHAQSNTRVYISDDDLMMFEHPADWEVITLPLSLRLLDANPAIGEEPTIRIDVVYPNTRGLRRGTYAGLEPRQVIEEFQLYLRDLYTFTPIVETQLLTKDIAYTTTGNDTIMLMVIDLGRNNIGLIVAQTPGNSVIAFESELLDVAQTALYLGPAADPDPNRPIIIPSGEEETPSDAVSPDAVGIPEGDVMTVFDAGASRPAALVTDGDPSHDGMVFLYYANGDLSLFSGGIVPVDISNFTFVAPDGEAFYSTDDLGYMMQSLFVPGACIQIRSVDIPFAAPDFCQTTSELLYLDGTTPTREFVWNAALVEHETFDVVQDGVVLATCEVAAGECMFNMPPSGFALLAPQ